MKRTAHLIALLVVCLFALFSGEISAQVDIENVIVETYYVSDANDATDTDGGFLEEGSVTYRIFLDLAPGVRLRSFFANADHPLSIQSTAPFFNNADRGEPYGFDIPDNRIDENTVALDSWLSFGAATTLKWGIGKESDPDGSVIGGVNNDGGSESVGGGLLVNESPDAGLPLTSADGLIPAETTALINFIASGDGLSAVFGDANSDLSFYSENFVLSNDGVYGQNEDNQILIAQLTTKGDLSFELNLQLIRDDGTLIRYVADDTVLGQNEFISSYLTYPPVCGCTDPDYLEYSSSAGCDDGSCSTLVVLGCADPLACNFDPEVNFNVQELCCILPNNCVGLDPDIICPGFVGIAETEPHDDFNLYPNPSNGMVSIDGDWMEGQVIFLNVTDEIGRSVFEKEYLISAVNATIPVDLSMLSHGLYHVAVRSDSSFRNFNLIRQ